MSNQVCVYTTKTFIEVCVYTTKTFIGEKPYILLVDAPEFIWGWQRAS
jgi:hypothetical protein